MFCMQAIRYRRYWNFFARQTTILSAGHARFVPIIEPTAHLHELHPTSPLTLTQPLLSIQLLYTSHSHQTSRHKPQLLTMEDHLITLPHKPSAPLHISLSPPSPPSSPLSTTLLIFLNGLLLPRSSWIPTISHLQATASAQNSPLPALLTYDRFGQGTSPRDPSDPPHSTNPYGHDAHTIITDLHALLTIISHSQLSTPLSNLTLILIANSIGCPLARLYAASHPGSVSGFLFLDSMMANTDFVSLFPDPESRPPPSVPKGITLDDLRHARARFKSMFHPSVPNKEGFDRRGLAGLLPAADAPRLPAGRGGREPVLVVVGHDPEVFAEEGEKGSLGVPKAVTNAYVNPAWRAYNEGLAKLADGSEVKIASGCGHFIQKDGPEFVAGEILRLLERVGR
ncbi:Alpha/beta hydrolase family-domain-containing protein [Cercophora newfieldiana]|uniref:Alpha/beta hydrolase family-domain-containing protein n=1 Tax=Cercophora newfieldiana TaxID=92897 RepID=A0AA39Y771_9PEZI|nr:Alpha/beta hydrolase family-domain-containing protein [Cercophora newfieldiana]